MKHKRYRLALIGFGNVGQTLAQVICDYGAIYQQQFGIELVIVAVSDARKGSVYEPGGLNLKALLGAEDALETIQATHKGWNALDTVQGAEYDILCEMSFTDLQTGEPASSYVRTALENGKHAVTTNKGPVALYYKELSQLAKDNHVVFGVEGSVMSGTPTMRLGQELLGGAGLQKIEGILNGTTNYILTQMENGMSYEDALNEAQSKGYAEADPTGDVEGFDAAGKVAILANVLMGIDLKVSDVVREGISKLTLQDIEDAKANGERWKLIGRLERQDSSVKASVKPQRISLTHPLANVMGATNALTYTTDLLGETTVIGAGAGRKETAYALLQDILAIHRQDVKL
ncbi:MAG: homoserine dehydrogenase [Trueperaceae bacterium]